MFSETGLESKVSEDLKREIEQSGKANLSYRELLALKKERKKNYIGNKEKI